ncbi:MAG: amylo-alpha-1,6-glucosidase [Bacteroidota bacterium]|nr:amylo-alpha-1,6-glucosidase [Bacteroidota bacterium]
MNIRNEAGLAAEILENGAIGWIEASPVMISLRRASVHSGAYANVWLRKKGSNRWFLPLTGPGSGSRFRVDGGIFFAEGNHDGIDYVCTFRLSDKSLSWEWRIDMRNGRGEDAELDLVCLQDVGLKTASPGLVNEYYVSQYTERRILEDPVHGKVVCCRQNMKESGGHPWMMMTSPGRAASACTDGMQFYGRSFRATGIPEGLLSDSLGGEYAGESSVVALQEEPFVLGAGESRTVRFALTFLHNHPPATSEADLDRLQGLVKEFSHDPFEGEASVRGQSGSSSRVKSHFTGTDYPEDSISTVPGLFGLPVLLQTECLDNDEIATLFPGNRRHEEWAEGRLLSFFRGDHSHVMLREKEILADRPHGHIMHSRTRLVPDERVMSTTCYAAGVFNSHITQGNTNFNTLLSVCNSQFNLNPYTGQRIFVTTGGARMLLGVPSAFEMGLNFCRWLYKEGSALYEVCTWTSGETAQVNTEFRVLRGGPAELLVTHDFDELNGWSLRPGTRSGEYSAFPSRDSMIASRYPEAGFIITIQFADNSFVAGGRGLECPEAWPCEPGLFAVRTLPVTRFCISFTGCVSEETSPVLFDDAGSQFTSDAEGAEDEWKEMSRALSLESKNPDIEAIREILPWFGMNAVTHFLTPYGLEQFSGAAWGTRDISQGPVELLLSMGKYAEARRVLEVVFSNQEPDGGWPQWWMFDRYNDIRADSAHGDVIYWCLIAVSSYIRSSGDFGFLNEKLPYYRKEEQSEIIITPLREHIDRLVKKVIGSFIPGRRLVQYGGGDWNDSLQPVGRDLAERLVSSWTVEMNYQAFMQYADVCAAVSDHERAAVMSSYAAGIREDFNRYLVCDGVVAGYGLAEDDGTISLLLHPSDTRTGIRYSLLPMERGIVSGIFTPEQAAYHLELIEKHLKGPDGARLMDRPLKYSGGIQKIFQRAESSTFFGREIGLMYVHEHIRYAEALARTGRAEAFLRALRQAVPADCRAVIPCADIRQSNCYYSSSDAIFENRYKADLQYGEILEGRITLRGGWRIYSSGPGIFSGIIMTHLLGIRREWGKYIIDPVLPPALDGLKATVKIEDSFVKFIYHVREGSCGPRRVVVNGTELNLHTEPNPYRAGGAVIDDKVFRDMPAGSINTAEIYL